MIDFSQKPWIAGMVHLPPLPSTPFCRDPLSAIRKHAVADALALKQGGAPACLVQTMDRVYSTDDECDPARVSAMTLIVGDIVDACGPDFQVGVQIMKNALSASLGVAATTGASFIRATAWIGETDSAFGRVRSNPERVSAYRRRVAPSVSVVADIHTPHFRWVGTETDLSRIAHWAVEAGADAVCVGDRDSNVTDTLIASVRRGRENLSIILPGFTTTDTAATRLAAADGAFVGSCLKDPDTGRIDPKRVARYMDRAKMSA